MSGAIIPPLAPDRNEKLVEAARVFLDAVEVEAKLSDPLYDKATVDAQRGMLVSMAVQALGMMGAHPPGMTFAAVCRAVGLGFGGLTVDLSQPVRIACLQLFVGGMQYSHEHTLHAAKPEGGMQ